ncbi:MAG: hypothetical protein NTV81_04235 [Candidatus Komeilibacteria bacterium]|nr:hypothetical protein [Candidatus Komeilibacteria bacterium]
MNLEGQESTLPIGILLAMADVLDKYISLPPTEANDNANRFGGYVTVIEFDPNYPQDITRYRLIVSARCGAPSPDKSLKYRQLADEKAFRLLGHLIFGHLTSRESSDPSIEKYPGAIVADGYVFSFSGLPADFDEAVCAVVAVFLGLLNREQLLAIVERTKNPHILEFGNLFEDLQKLLAE